MKNELRKYRFAEEFTKYPGGRLRQHGPFSGEEFREDVLIPLLKEHNLIEVDLSGTKGFGGSFIDEAFGEVAKRMGLEQALRQLRFIATDDPMLPDVVVAKMQKAARIG